MKSQNRNANARLGAAELVAHYEGNVGVALRLVDFLAGAWSCLCCVSYPQKLIGLFVLFESNVLENEQTSPKQVLGTVVAALLTTRIMRQHPMEIFEPEDRTGFAQSAVYVNRSEKRAVFGCGTPAKIVPGSRNRRPAQLPPACFTDVGSAVDRVKQRAGRRIYASLSGIYVADGRIFNSRNVRFEGNAIKTP